MGRMKSFEDAGASGSNPADIEWEYDRVGNVRIGQFEIHADCTGLQSRTNSETEHWYTYDKMDRMVEASWASSPASAARRDRHRHLDRRQRLRPLQCRRRADRVRHQLLHFRRRRRGLRPDQGRIFLRRPGLSRECHPIHPAADLITQQPTGPWSTPVLIASDTRDALGRLTAHDEYQNDENVYSTSTVYNELSLKTSEATSPIQFDDSLLTTNATFDYKAESSPGSGLWTGDFQGGVVTHVRTVTNLSATAQHTTNSYVWWDDARLSVVTNKPSATVTYTSTYSYDENGKLASVNIQDGRAQIVNFVTDLYGQVMSRTEYTPSTPNQNNPKDIYYYFNGLRVGDIGNNGPSQVDYVTAISERGAPPQTGPFKNGMATYHADFNQAFDPISPGSEPSAAGRYVVRDGDTLQSIARAVWGDSAMWYLIADANGLSGSATLVAGQTIRIPPKVTNLHNNSDTFRVYDPNEAIGDVSPTQAGPPRTARRGGGCGILGQIILIAIAVAITLIIKVPVTSFITAALKTAVGVGVGAGRRRRGRGRRGRDRRDRQRRQPGHRHGHRHPGKVQLEGGGAVCAVGRRQPGRRRRPLINGAGKFVNDVVRGALVKRGDAGHRGPHRPAEEVRLAGDRQSPAWSAA